VSAFPEVFEHDEQLIWRLREYWWIKDKFSICI